ncbi:hypothetical protein NPIL_507751, partial [Nephila pilipes]
MLIKLGGETDSPNNLQVAACSGLSGSGIP